MDTECLVGILAVGVSVISILVAIVAVILGYNVLVYKKKVNKRLKDFEDKINVVLKDLENITDEKIATALSKSIDLAAIQVKFGDFVKEDIKAGIIKERDGLMDIINALDIVARMENPFVSATILNHLYKILIGIDKNPDAFKPQSPMLWDYSQLKYAVDNNIKIAMQGGKANTLLRNPDGTAAVKDAVNQFFDLYINTQTKI